MKGLAKNYLVFLTIFLLGFVILNYTLSASANDSTMVNITPSADSWVESYPLYDYNYGSASILHVRNTTDSTDRQTFLRFDLSGIPPGADITSATLKIYPMWKSDPRTVFLSVYFVSDDSWVEGNGNDTGCNATETGTCGASPGEYAISWNHKPEIGQFINTTTVSLDKWASWVVTDAVEAEYNNDKNITLALSFPGGYQYHHKDFYSSEYSDYIPYLEIIYTGAICGQYSDETSCEADTVCDWCPGCDILMVNTWGIGTCVDTGVDCGYHCDELFCGAECDQNSDCSCPTDDCNGYLMYVYPSYGTCDTGDCTCDTGTGYGQPCEPTVYCDVGCGAECDEQNSCPDTECDYLDGCVGFDYYDYDDVSNECLIDCTCENNACGNPTIYTNDPRCTECQTHDDCGFCLKCVDYNCVYQSDSEDLKDQCSSGDCASGFCNGAGACDYELLSTPCELDQNLCTIDHCDGSGSCVTYGNVNCSFLNNQCREGVCNPQTGNCYYTNYSLSTPCDNGLYCDGNDHCDGVGNCVNLGPVIDCSHLNDQCNEGLCDEGLDTCYASPINEGLSCDDSLFCNVGETCQSGTCTGGSARDCSDSNECTDDICNEDFNQCEYAAKSDGTYCGLSRDCQDDVCNGPFHEIYPPDGHDYCSSGTCAVYSCGLLFSHCSDDNTTDGINALTCGADCDQDSDCSPNSCSKTYYDDCVDSKLREYDNDKILDSTTVTGSCNNICQDNCTCTACSVTCPPPATNTYCVKDVCGAECDDSGCVPKIVGNICYYDGSCDLENCDCIYSQEYCPNPGTIINDICYWGVEACVNVDGCTANQSPMYNNDTCDPNIGPTFTAPNVENVTTENTTFCNNVMITVQVWDKDGVDTVLLYDTQIVGKYDFGIPASPVEVGFINVTNYTSYNPSLGYGWDTNPLDGRDRGSGTDLTRDFIFDTDDREFKVDLPNGMYYLTVYLGDMSYAHDNMDVTAEGTVLADNENTVAGEVKPFSSFVTVSDGQLNVLFHDDGGSNPHWTSNGLIVSKTTMHVMTPVGGNNYSVTFHPDPGNHEIRFIANDTKGNKNDTVTASFYIYSAPSILGVNITPGNPNMTSILNCIPYGGYDPDGDLKGYYYQWYNNEISIPGATDSTYDCSILGCDKGDIIYCEVTPYDSYQNGTSVNGSVVIGNLPPSTPNLSPSTGTFHDIVYINCSGSVDPDGDIITYQIQTDVNGTWKNIVTNDSDGYFEWDISDYPCKNNVDLRCRAFDGINYSSWKNPAGKINIDNCGPTVILVDPTPADGIRVLNNWIFVNAIVVDNQSEIDTCTLEWNGVNETMNKSTYDIIVDDGDTGYTDTGWSYASGQGYGNDVHYIINGIGSQVATWKPNVSGRFDVYVSWTTHPNRATNAKYTVYHDGGLNTTAVNQELLADQITTGGSGEWSGWYYLGKYNLTSGNVTLNDNANEYVIADAVKFTIETCGLNKTTFDCGNYTYKVYANDTLGNEGNSSTRNNEENKEPDVPLLLSPTNSTTIKNGTTILFDWTDSSDCDGDNVCYDLLVDNDSDFASPELSKTCLNNSNYTSMPGEILPKDDAYTTYYWKVRAYDLYEYSNYSSVWAFIIDAKPPRVENSSVMGITECNDLNITVDAWDESGISTVILEDIYIINQSYQMNNIGNNTYRVTIHPCRGNHTIRYYANDTVGNVNDSVTDWFNVTLTTPKVVSVVINPYFVYNNSIYIGTGNIQFNITFNKPMNTSIPLSVNYGNVTPYNKYNVIGNWTSPKTWSGISTVNSSFPNGNYTLNISGGMDQSCNSLFAGQIMVENTSTWFIIDTNVPRVVSVVLSLPGVNNNINCLKEGNVTFTITFEPNMNTSVNPTVTFGKYQPYNTYVVNGSWLNSTTWVGYFYITSSMPNGRYTLSISGAQDLLGRTMTPNNAYGFNVDTMPPMIRQISTSNITTEENETVTIEVKDYDCAGYEACGLDTVLVELNNSVNYTMKLGYYDSLAGYYVYYYIIPNTSYGFGDQYLRFYANDSAGNMNSNSTAMFYVNNTIPKVGGKIAFLCRYEPISNTCYDGIEGSLISWLRDQGWNVTVKIYNKWNKTSLSGYDLMVCSDEKYACDYATKSTTDVYYMHKNSKIPFVEISDDSLLRAAKNFGYVRYTGGSIENNINSLYVTISHPITTGYFGNTQIFTTKRAMTSISDLMLNGVKDIADAGNEDKKSTLFSNDQPGRFVYIGWFYNGFSSNALGKTILARAISWAQCGNAKGCK